MSLKSWARNMNGEPEKAPEPPYVPPGVDPPPAVEQRRDYACGAAAFLSVLQQRLGDRSPVKTEADALRILNADPDTGIEPNVIAEKLRACGLRATVKKRMTMADLDAELGRGATAVLLVQSRDGRGTGWDDGHYVVANGAPMLVMDPDAPGGVGSWNPASLADRWRGIDEHGDRVEGLAVVVGK